jgi:hypothetical protein
MRLRHGYAGPAVADSEPCDPRDEGLAFRLRLAAERAERAGLPYARRPVATALGLLALNLALVACFVAVGSLAFGDRAELFRELMPGTWLSFGLLCFAASLAWALHLRTRDCRRWWETFWGLSAAAFALFAFDEITQAAIWISALLEHGFGARATGGFHDLEAVLLTLLFAGVALLLLPRALVLRRHLAALALFAMAVLLGAASQGLDSFAAATSWEFVTEESLKLAAEAFFVGGFLAALRDVAGWAPRPAARPASRTA